MNIMPNRMDRGFYKYQNEFENKALEVLRSGWYVLGKEVSSFEEEFASYVGTKHCVGLASGLDGSLDCFQITTHWSRGRSTGTGQYLYCICYGYYYEWCNAYFY